MTRVDSVSLGIVVNQEGIRFYDEGEDFWPKRYAIWGRLIADQPDQIAYSIIDRKSMGLFVPPVYPPIEAATLPELAGQLSIASGTLERTVADFNGRRPGGHLRPCGARRLSNRSADRPQKSHWARPLDTPPYFAYPLRPGITFTYRGVAVNERAQVVMNNNVATDNVFAAGETMAGNILGKGYLAGIGMTIGTVFGRIAGEEAARSVLS